MQLPREIAKGYGPRMIALMVISGFAAFDMGAANYSVTGDVTYENFFAREQIREGYLPFQPIVTQTNQFSLVVSNDCWRMRVTASATAGAAYNEAAFDGTTLYFMQGTGLEVEKGYIFDNQHVIYDITAHEMGPVWLMFGSAKFWSQATNTFVQPATILGLFEIQEFYKKPFTLRAHWSLQEDYPQLPVYVAYVDDGMVKTGPESQPYPRKPPFDKGFTNTVFQVLSFTNIAGVKLPLTGQLDTFRPEPRGLRPELLHYTQYRISLKRWSSTPEPVSFRPVLPGPTPITDYRLYETVRSYTYVAADWPSLDQVTNTLSYKEKAAQYKTLRAAGRRSK